MPATLIEELSRRRHGANAACFAQWAPAIARLCHRTAERFARGGRLIAFGDSAQARSDARHVAVEFVHPVIVGKRALPAIGLGREAGRLPAQAALLLEPADIAIAFGEAAEQDLREVVALARERGCLTISFASLGAEWEFDPPPADPFVRQELIETHYHLLWELVHVFFEHRGLLADRLHRGTTDAGAASFLYPFLGQTEHDLDAVLADVERSVRLKAEEIGALRAATLSENRPALIAAAALLRTTFDRGGQVLVLGNGGSATDAMDAVADFRCAPQGWPARRALDLTEDTGILTALANDIGAEAMFARQIIAWSRPGDLVLSFSTSGGSRNVLAALDEARRRSLPTVAMVGYDGGRIVSAGLAQVAIVVRSEHIPRIQEAQATAFHVLRELVERTVTEIEE